MRRVEKEIKEKRMGAEQRKEKDEEGNMGRGDIRERWGRKLRGQEERDEKRRGKWG